MSWILVIYILSSAGGVGIEKIDGFSQAECQRAAEKVRSEKPSFTTSTYWAVCLERKAQ